MKKTITPQVESADKIVVQLKLNSLGSNILIKKVGSSQTINALKNHRLVRQKSETASPGERYKSPSQYIKRSRETEGESSPAVFRKLQIKNSLYTRKQAAV